MVSWIAEELSTTEFGDKRLNQRLGLLLGALESKPSLSIPAACKGWAETQAAYRFFNNEKVTRDALLASHISATKQRMLNHRVVLCIEDTTFINYDDQKHISDLGPHTSDKEYGYFLHPQVAFTPERLCLGALRAHSWVRDEKFGKRKLHRTKPIEEKESQRWIDGYRHTCELQKELDTTNLVYVADRESDIYELFVAGIDGEANWLIRAVRNRKTLEANKIWESLADEPTLGSLTIKLSHQKKRKRRNATLSLYSKKLSLVGPRRHNVGVLPNVEVTAIQAIEMNPPEGEDPVEWLILTNMTVNTFDEAKEKLSWYACRWQIEIYFNTLKSGCGIEKLQLETRKRLEVAVGLYMIVAWRLLYIKTLNQFCPEASCELVFEKEEWQAIYLITQEKSPPPEPPSLDKIVIMLATLGGYLNRKNDGPPGPKVLWIGLQRVRDFVLALKCTNQFENMKLVCNDEP